MKSRPRANGRAGFPVVPPAWTNDMSVSRKDIWLGSGVIAFGGFLLLYAIPTFVHTPSNVRALVLSPLFWPTIIAFLIILLGALLILSRLFGPSPIASEQTAVFEVSRDELLFAWLRLGASAVVMAGLVQATPLLGMVISTGLAFAAFAAIVMTPRPIAAAILAILLPLVLYLFFSHVAGVSVPQGRFLTLP